MNHPPLRPLAAGLKAATAIAVTTLSASAGNYSNDFSTASPGLTIYTLAGAPPEVRPTDGNPGGYLKLTDAVGNTTSTVVFPDFDGGFPVQAFTFDVDCRIGNGSDTPADGFCIAFARTGDPVITTGAGFVGGGAEEGTTTGLAIGFDTYDNDPAGDVDNIGFTVRLDGQIIREVSAPVLNGDVTNADSLQTGTVGNAGWAHFKVELRTDGTLDITWKGTKVVDNLSTGWTPSGGRMVFAARTGGANEAHHFDNLVITTTPAPVAAVTSAKVNDQGYKFEITDFSTTSVVTPANVGALTIDGAVVTPTSVAKAGNVTTVTYVPATAVVNHSAHTYDLDFKDQANISLSGSGPLNSPAMPSGPLLAVTPEDGIWNVREVRDGPLPEPFDIGGAAGKLKAAVSPMDSATPFINFSDPNSAGDRGLFKLDTPFITNDANADDNDIVQAANISVQITGTTPAELQRTFWVQSDDAFALRAVGAKFITKNGGGLIDPAEEATLIFPGGTGNSNTRGLVQFPAAGNYVLEFLYAEGAGGAFNEVAWVNGDYVNNPDAANWALVGGKDAFPVFPSPLPVTPTGAPVGQWNLREIRNSGKSGTLADAITYTSANDFTGAAVNDGIRPVLNYNDLGAGGVIGATGIFNNDVDLIANQAGADDNNFIVVGRITVPVPAAGDYSLEGIADDGFAVKIVTPGARFVASGGPGGIDPLDSTTFYNPTYSDTPTVAAARFDAAGNYDILFLSQEGGGGVSGELAFAPGRFTTIGGTGAWQLLGTSTGLPAPTPFLPATLPGPEGGAGLWGIRFIRNVPAQGDNIYNALASVLNTATNGAALTDTTTPYLNYSNIGGTAGQENMGLFRTNNADNAGLYAVADKDYPETTGEEDAVVAIAKARIIIPTDGDWTFGVHSDDGVALRIDGAAFTRVSGDSWIDTGDTGTLYFRFGTGDSNVRAVTNLTAGEHDIEFIWFEGTVNSHFELYAAPGAFNNDGDSPNWRLVGDTAAGGLALAAASAPTDPNFQITAVSYNAATSVVTLSFPSTAGTQYGIEWSSTLSNSPWPSAGTVTGAAGTTTTTVNAATLNGGTAPQRFFVRVRGPN
ncbi:MAG: PA14 domain-containing protein [Verrucomicrobiota bacterium]